MQYTIVVLNADNRVGHRIRTFDRYPDALGYLLRNLPRRSNLDMVNSDGLFVAWEFECQPIATACGSAKPVRDILDDAEQTLITAALMFYAECLGMIEAENLAIRLSPTLT